MLSALPPTRRILFAATVFLSAFLLFAIEPLTAKRILPWFGGSAAVWSTCLVFYQTALLLGYAYAAFLSRRVSPGMGAGIHLALLAGSLLLLPIGPSDRWRVVASNHPALSILEMLTASIGIPFLALSATSPLLQHWIARSGYRAPYRLFALSNVASLLALLSYPVVVEPLLDTTQQALLWSVLFTLFCVCCASIAWKSRRSVTAVSVAGEHLYILPDRFLAWFLLAAASSMLLLSVTNHMDANVAAVPLLWVIPLALYLLTFVLSFGSARPPRRALWLRLLAFSLGVLGYSIYNVNAIEALQVSIPILLVGLFFCCMFCHGELHRLRPDASGLTTFYLVIAAGGATGAMVVGLVAPVLFNAVYELPISLAFLAFLALALTWREGNWPLRALWSAVAVCMLLVIGANVRTYTQNSISLNRNFYGSLRVVESPHAGPAQTRTLFHGTIEHGAQYRLLPARLRPSTYYGPDSGIGILLREGFEGPKRVGVVGLGTGTIAAFGRPGDLFRFYELNPQVSAIATTLFTYLRESKATTQIVGGDARLSLQAESNQPRYDVLALDAFSGDAIPVHLLTLEAMQLYRRRIRPNGVLAINVSNNFLDLAPLVTQLAQTVDWRSVLVRSHEDVDEGLLPADWMLLTTNQALLNNDSILTHALPVASSSSLRLWTDRDNNLLEVLKTPKLQ